MKPHCHIERFTMSNIIRDFLISKPDLLRRYERSEARYILSMRDDYATMDIDLDISKDEFMHLVLALAELDLSIDEWIAFKLKEIILAEKMKGFLSESTH